MDFRKLDKRVIKRNLEDGSITAKEYKKYCSELKDLKDDYEVIKAGLDDDDQEDEVEENAVDPAGAGATPGDNNEVE
ncbi:MAG: hypothetical protein GY854_13380 [Deltaproteobacteria bacterium]|nr:hypothetical protein [Deltaproteobacteria bacterium]